MKKVIRRLNYEDRIIRLFDWKEYENGLPVENIECFNTKGDKLWTISSLTESDPADCWTNINIKNDKLIGYNFMGYECEIDIFRGFILNKKFTK